jgi:hypothetical protein
MKNTFYGLYLEERSSNNDDWMDAEVSPVDCYKTRKDAIRARKAITDGLKPNPLSRYVVTREVYE